MKPARSTLLLVVTLPVLFASLGLAGGIAFAGAPGQAGATHLVPPAKGKIAVAFVLSDHAVMIDFAGPWEVFQDAMVESRGATMDEQMPFELYTVAESRAPIHVSGGMQIVPDFTFDDAPPAKIVVVPAQHSSSPKMLAWLRSRTTQSDVVMSVCTGAFKLAAAGLLDGKPATTHHASYSRLHHDFPAVQVQKDRRWVQSDAVVFTAGGLSAGIDLALHIVDLYFGRTVAEKTARSMEYEGRGWIGDGASSVTYSALPPTAHPSDPLTHGLLGNWRGSVQSPEGATQVLLHLWRDEAGHLTGVLDSIDDDVTDLPLSALSEAGSTLHFELAAVGGTFDATLSPDESTLTGTLKQHGAKVPMTLQRQ